LIKGDLLTFAILFAHLLNFRSRFYSEVNCLKSSKEIYIAILNELWKKAILKNLLKAKDLKMSD